MSSSRKTMFSPKQAEDFIGVDAELQAMFDSITPNDVSMTPNHEYEPNQMHQELLNVMSMSPFNNGTSGARQQMYGASHITQTLVIKGSTPRRFQTGAEQEYGKATFCTKAEHDCEVLQKFRYYTPNAHEANGIKKNPMQALIVETIGANPEDPDAREIDVIYLTDYMSMHQYFGYNLISKDFVAGLNKGSFIKAGTVLQDSPNKHADGNYCVGRELNCVLASFDAVAEDGVILSEEAVPWFEITKFERRTVSWGTTHYPKNLYGDENNYKPFPDIGDYIRPDGLLMALSSYDKNFSAVEMSKGNLKRVAYTHDKLFYAPSGRGRVIDIRIRHDATQAAVSPGICNTQAIKYDEAARQFYQEVYAFHVETLKRRYGDKLRMSNKYRQLIRTAYAVLQERAPRQRGQDTDKAQKIYRGSPMDDFTVEFTIEYKSLPKVGNKITDCFGGKGVIVKIWPKERMPVDEQGNRAHIIMDDIATINRMNLGRLYEQYGNASSRDYVKKLCGILNMAPPDINGPRLGGRTLNYAERTTIKNLVRAENPELMQWWHGFKDLVGIINPVLKERFYETQVDPNPDLIAEHIASIVEDGIYHFHPTSADPELPDMLRQLRDRFPAHKSRLTFIGNTGKRVTTRFPVLVGSMYFMLLEKTGDDWNAVSSGRLQGYGILSQINNQDKYSSPWRQQAIRAWGETETAIANSYLGWKPIAVIIDRNNNIDTHRACVTDVLTAKYPTNIEYIGANGPAKLGGAKPLQLVNHLAMCNGWAFNYQPYVEMSPKPNAITFTNAPMVKV